MTEPQITPQRLRTLYVMKILLRYTDEDHILSASGIAGRLRDYGVEAERKAIYSDINILRQFGMDIETIPNVGFYLSSRDFELPELKVLVDAVQSSKFITVKKSNELIRKLEALTSESKAKQLQRQVFIRNRLKSESKSVYYNADKIHAAINGNAQISFQYCEWTPDKKLVVRKNGERYIVSPWALSWDDENYYLVGCTVIDGEICVRHYRVDKMKNLEIQSAERFGRKEFEGFNLPEYAKKTFGMFGGVDHLVSLRCEKQLVGVIIDRFGRGVPIIPEADDHFRVNVPVAVSPQFFGWVTGIGEGMTIIGPVEVVNEYRAYLERLVKRYE